MSKDELIKDFSTLDRVETTSEYNGYPRNLCHAYVGFDSFEQAQAIADEFNLQLIWLTARDGQHIWTRLSQAYEPLNVTSEDFADDYNFEYSIDLCRERFAEDAYQLGNELTSENLRVFTRDLEEIEDAFESKGDDEVVITFCGTYYRTQELHPIEFSFDGRTTILGAIDLDEEEE